MDPRLKQISDLLASVIRATEDLSDFIPTDENSEDIHALVQQSELAASLLAQVELKRTKAPQELPHKADEFGGILVDPNAFDGIQTAADARRDISHSLELWSSQKRRGIWLHLPASKSHLLPEIQRLQFSIHHATNEHVLLTKWLPIDELNQLPHYATCQLGAGGIVINTALKSVLLIKEAKGSFKGWKLPGGCIDRGEPIDVGVQREVFEEVGVKATFVSIISLGHHHNARGWGIDDIYFKCLLTTEETEIKRDPNEIADAKWFTWEELPSASLTPYIGPFVTTCMEAVLSDGYPTRMWKKVQQGFRAVYS